MTTETRVSGASDAPVRVVVPFTKLHPVTARRLNRYAPGHERVRLDPGDDEAYWRVLADAWAGTNDLVVVEHDIGIHGQVLPGFAACWQPWCGHAYRLHRETRMCLGCTRFTAELQGAEPDLLEVVGKDTSGEAPPKVWWRLDVRLQAELERRGYRQHEHLPQVAHYHRYPARRTV